MPKECQEVRERLSALLDGELTAASRAAVGAHLQSCDACRFELAQLSALEGSLAHLAAPVPPHLAERVLARLRPQRRAWWQNLAIAASFIIGIILGGAVARDFYPLGAEPGNGAEIMALEDFRDFPQGSLGAILVSYQAEEGNGT